MKDLQGKVALVTGGAKGVGRIIAARLAERGAHVIINFFHSLHAAKQTQAELEARGAKITTIRASVARPAQVDRMFEQIAAEIGYLDILVNNAASGMFAESDEIDEAIFNRALDTNLKGSFWCARRAAPLMAKRGGGAIVNLSSVGSFQVAADYLTVGTSKAALESLTRYLAYEYGPLDIRVNTASAGMLDNEVAHRFPRYEEMCRNIVQATPLGRVGTEEDLAALVLFLVSDQSRFITGQTILADGGMSLGGSILAPRAGMRAVERLPAAQSTPSTSATEGPDDAVDDDREEIAIVGMGLAVPGANNPEEFWSLLMEGPELFRYVPLERWENRSFYAVDPNAEDKTYQNASGFITDFRPTEQLRAELSDQSGDYELTTLWLRHSLYQALDGVKQLPSDRFSFVVGYTPDGNQHLEEAMVTASTMHHLQTVIGRLDAPASEKEKLACDARQSLERYYWRGAANPSRLLPHRVGLSAMNGILPEQTELLLVDTACSSSLYALDIGIKGLLTGKHDIAACGGSFALGPRSSVLFAKLHGLSTSGKVRPLDKAADGVLFSDGSGVVILKKLRRALQDGDRILAVIKAFGASSDGKGKAIYAPSPDGQVIAIDRALAQPAIGQQKVDWVVAHATGTPAGDLTEFTALAERLKADHPIYVTSNKSLIGHTGWAAGVVSLIQVVLGLQKQVIPPQHHFSEPPTLFKIESTNLKIPTQPVEWKTKPSTPRSAAISGFGFGGTNAHMIVEEYRPDAEPTPVVSRAYGERIAVVGWAAHVPGLGSREEVERWLLGEGRTPQNSFGEFYPMPSFEAVRMPPKTVRTIDRCQLMILECAHNLRRQLGDFWEANKSLTGVILGHMGLTRHSTLYGARCYLEDVERVLRQSVQSSLLDPAIAGLRREVTRLVPASNEDSFPGIMPNVIPARVANYFDLKGLNMTVDTGFSSAHSAIDIACRYLRSKELEMVLVGGIQGNTTPEITDMLRKHLNNPSVQIAEGSFLFALTTESTAVKSGLPVLGYLETATDHAGAPLVECGLGTSSPTYMGAEGALGLLKAIVRGLPEATICCRAETPATTSFLRFSAPDHGSAPPEDEGHTQRTMVCGEQVTIPVQFTDSQNCQPDLPLELRRYVATLKPFPASVVRNPIPFLTGDTLVITDRPEMLAGVQNGATILSVRPVPAGMTNAHYLPEITPEAVQQVIDRIGGPTPHLRLVTDLNALAPVQHSLTEEPDMLVKLHDLAFLVLKQSFNRLAQGNSSFLSLFLDGLPGGVLHPYTGFFTGLVKSAALELSECTIISVFTTATSFAEGMRQAEAESACRQMLPVVIYADGVRKTVRVAEVPGELPANGLASIGPGSLVVATAGARGITAELLKAVAQHFRPHLYLIGSNHLDRYPPEIFQGSDEEFAAGRPAYLREQKALHPGKSFGQLNKEFDRILEARTAGQNIATMERFCGPGKVRYLACDVTDRAALEQVFAQIRREQNRPIDLLINAAGLNRSAAIPAKNFEDFQAIRNIKLRGYLNLKHVLADHPPRMWCNFGSFIGLTGQRGETDYASGNDFLSTAAIYTQEALGRDEFTIGWTLWKSVGLGANAITRAFLEKSALFTSMSTAEGIHHFIRELCLTQPEPATFHLGAAERNAITSVIPDYFTTPITAVSPPKGTFYLGQELLRSADEVLFERIFDLEKDAYLAHHLVNGYATLPGTFVPEVAAEAASSLLPGWHVIAFEDVVFHHFLRVYDKIKPSVKKIHARIVDQSSDQATVRVKVLTDVIAPNGVVLSRDKLHFELRVVMSKRVPQAPQWVPWDAAGEESIPDPYHFAQAPVLLTDMFVSTTNTRQHPLGKRATYQLAAAPNDPIFSSFIVPSILLDGLARIAVLEPVEEEYLPLAAPASIRRIDLYEAVSDCQLAQQYQRVELYATPRHINLEQASSNRFVAVRPDGKIILQMKDVTGTIVGYVHRNSGEFLSPQQIEELRRAQAALARPKS